MTAYDLTEGAPAKLRTGDIVNVPYSGAVQSLTLKKGTYKLEVWGAQGGNYNTTYCGGKGGYSVGTLALAEDTEVYCYAGGQGKIRSSASGWATIDGGWNGGGWARSYNTLYVGSGGGGSDIRLRQDSLYARVIVAGGGGGSGYNSTLPYGQAGGGVNGGGGGAGTGIKNYTGYKSGTKPTYGSATTPGDVHCYQSNEVSSSQVALFGSGGSMYANNTNNTSTGAGGGGWYGGGCQNHYGGGGGSGYVYTSSTASNYPSGCLLTSADYLTDAATTIGTSSFTAPGGSSETGHSGDGYCRITAVSVQAEVDVVLVDSGTVSTQTVEEDTAITLPSGSAGRGTFAGWWDGSNLIPAGEYTVTEAMTLYACYAESGSYATVDFVGLTPNPIAVGGTVLATVEVSEHTVDIPRWASLSLKADGLPMSSPWQATIWDTREPSDWAVFEGDGIPTSGAVAPPIEATATVEPRVAVWSDAVSDGDGAVSWTIEGTVDAEYTSGIVVYSREDCAITAATVVYTASDGSTSTASATGTGGRIALPSGTYSSFAVTITALAGAYRHVVVLDVRPGA